MRGSNVVRLIHRWRWRFLLDLVFLAGVSHLLVTGQLIPQPLQELLRGDSTISAVVEEVGDLVPSDVEIEPLQVDEPVIDPST